jgi:hypothetical protein
MDGQRLIRLILPERWVVGVEMDRIDEAIESFARASDSVAFYRSVSTWRSAASV